MPSYQNNTFDDIVYRNSTYYGTAEYLKSKVNSNSWEPVKGEDFINSVNESVIWKSDLVYTAPINASILHEFTVAPIIRWSSTKRQIGNYWWDSTVKLDTCCNGWRPEYQEHCSIDDNVNISSLIVIDIDAEKKSDGYDNMYWEAKLRRMAYRIGKYTFYNMNNKDGGTEDVDYLHTYCKWTERQSITDKARGLVYTRSFISYGLYTYDGHLFSLNRNVEVDVGWDAFADTYFETTLDCTYPGNYDLYSKTVCTDAKRIFYLYSTVQN
ncbi:MAG: hypothetical protein J6Y78_08925 [Paludibacteraceae bacterium]|nr:hypothetical protein [Paludibacteraceae bacterium]